MRCGWGSYFRRTFEVQAGNSPLQGQSKPPAKLVVLISKSLNTFEHFMMKYQDSEKQACHSSSY